MRTWKLYVWLFCWLASGVLAAQELRVVMMDIPSSPTDYANLQNPQNPFAVINTIGTEKVTILPPPRAVAEFCADNFDLIYPVVGSLKECELDLVKVMSIEAVIYTKKEFRKVTQLGLRAGFEYDLKKIQQWLPLMQQQKWLNSDEQMLKMLASDRVDAVLLEQKSAQRIAQELKLDLKTFKRLHHSTLPVYIGVKSSRADISIKLRQILLNRGTQ